MAYVHPVYHGGKNQPEQVTDEYLTCAICQVPGFRAPKTMPCGHIFCFECLDRLYQATGRPGGPSGPQDGGAPFGVLACPTCGQNNKIPPQGVACLQNNIFTATQVDRLVRRHNQERFRNDAMYNIGCYNLDGHFTAHLHN